MYIYMTVPSGRATDSKMMVQVGSICIYIYDSAKW